MAINASSLATKTKSEISSQQSKINQDQSSIAKDKQNISSQSSKVNADKQSVSSAQVNVSSKQSAVSSAQSNVNADNQRINDIHHAESIASSAQSKVNADKQDVSSKQSSQSNAQQAYNHAKNNQSSADSKVASAQSSLTNAQNKETADQNTVNSLNGQLVNINDQIGAQPTLTLPQGYVDLVNQSQTTAVNDGPDSDAYNKVDKELGQIGAKGLSMNTYTPSKADESETLDPSNITYDQAKDLTIFAAQLINQIRAQFGTAPVQVTNNSIKFAMDCADQYVKDHWDPLAWHDEVGLGKVEDQWGINSGSSHTQYYEDAGCMPWYGAAGTTPYYSDGKPKQAFLLPKTLGDAKGQIYSTIMQMLFNDSTCGWLHAGS